MTRIFYSLLCGAIFFCCGCNDGASGKPGVPPINDSLAGGRDGQPVFPDWAMTGFKKLDSVNPIMQPGRNHFTDPVSGKTNFWESKNVFNPATVVRQDTLFMLYRAQDSLGAGTSRIGLAWSRDGIHFNREMEPVFYPDNSRFHSLEWPGGCEDPRIVEDSSGRYIMTYTSYDGTLARLLVATSTDLRHWVRYGPVFQDAMKGKYKNVWSKSGSILSRYSGGRIVATRVNGKYFMFWGDLFIWGAVSDDLLHWTPVEMKAGEKPLVPLYGVAEKVPALKIVIPTRKGYFDSDLVESGPPAMMTSKGILLLYNSRSLLKGGDPALPHGTYTAGQVLLDSTDPTRIIQRLDHYFIRPEKSYELTGEVNNVCFIEGLARYGGNWFLYYGTADSRIAVAVRPAPADRTP